MTMTIDLALTKGRGTCDLCRDLIAQGTDPETLIQFTRGSTPVFAATPIKWWVARRVREADDGGPMRFVLSGD